MDNVIETNFAATGYTLESNLQTEPIVIVPKTFTVQKFFGSSVEKKTNTYSATKINHSKSFKSEMHPQVIDDYDWVIYDGGEV